ncbi:NAD(P)/FAD-dependent oxidoreductase [Croceiramulus getboli]|nr:FAD-dependent oxidoreductase [Flavobacteriaceae bacterium YJPT1-3]
MKKKIVIIGGGIMGLSCAYFLNKSGHEVTVIDQSTMDGGASYVNAGYLSPSHLIPLAAPGVMKQGIQWMFNPKSPLFIKPRLDPDFLRWSWAFNKSCSQEHVRRSVPAMKAIAVLGRDLYHQIKKEEGFGFQLESKGLFMLCQTEHMLEEESAVVEIANDQGLVARTLSASEIRSMMPDADPDIIGGTYFECDHHTTPGEFMQELKTHLVREGVTLRKEERVLDIDVSGKTIRSVRTDRERVEADEFVMAAGSWSSALSRKLNLKLLLQAGKGYRIQSETPTGITYPSILAEAKIAITPMNGFTRFAGTMEIAGINQKINQKRVDAIAEGVARYFPEVKISEEEKAQAACGLRPVTPDGMPYIGKSKQCVNLTLATGHAMMGWSLGPATGKLVQEIIDDQKTSVPMERFDPDRRF